MPALRSARFGRWPIVALAIAVAPTSTAWAETPPSDEAWRTSPYHGALDGAGRPIPCLCLFRDRKYTLGAHVCMQTPDGIRLTRCDLIQNNTSWVPTDQPCTTSSLTEPDATGKKS